MLGQRKPHAYKTFHRYDVLQPEYLDRPDYIETIKQEHARRLAYDALEEGFIEHKRSESLSGEQTLTSTISVGLVRQNTDTAPADETEAMFRRAKERDALALKRDTYAQHYTATFASVSAQARLSAFGAGTVQGPTGPTGPAGPVSAVYRQSVASNLMGRRPDQIWLDDVWDNSSAAPAKDTAASALQDFADYVADLELKLVAGASATVFFHAIKTELTQRISKGT
jgi:hypothetical protein